MPVRGRLDSDLPHVPVRCVVADRERRDTRAVPTGSTMRVRVQAQRRRTELPRTPGGPTYQRFNSTVTGRVDHFSGYALADRKEKAGDAQIEGF